MGQKPILVPAARSALNELKYHTLLDLGLEPENWHGVNNRERGLVGNRMTQRLLTLGLTQLIKGERYHESEPNTAGSSSTSAFQVRGSH